MKSYITKPKSIKKSEIVEKEFSFSLQKFYTLKCHNTNIKKIIDLKEESFLGKNPEQVNVESNHKILKISSSSDNLFRNNSNESFYTKPFSYRLTNGKWILFATRGSVQKISFVEIKEMDNIIHSNNMYAVKIKENHFFYSLAFLKSQLLVNYATSISHGGTISEFLPHQILNFFIPFPTINNHQEPEKIEKLVSIITQNIIDKEEKINEKNKKIDNLIENELRENQKSGNNFKYSYPKISEIKKESRLDTGIYEREFKEIDFLIRNYEGGFDFIDENNIKSGCTPTSRLIGKNPRFKYNWMSPTNISDFGGYKEFERIHCESNNLNKDSILIINRTSKGKKGEYVGITSFYDFKLFKEGQHNQGIYRVENYPKNTLKFITCIMNCNLIRKYCGNISIGSKMKEIKSDQFIKIPIPNFPDSKQQEIAKEYYNKIDKNQNLNLDNYLELERARNDQLGIFQLNMEIFTLREKLEDIIDKIINDKKIDINLNC